MLLKNYTYLSAEDRQILPCAFCDKIGAAPCAICGKAACQTHLSHGHIDGLSKDDNIWLISWYCYQHDQEEIDAFRS